ncbi:CLUMA_CG003103, isoform A [Clunio marinus]|uniref:CLUMA_CG003103, isoform A n=1 Tax=Clunio marinus TaxID=568069 RepID=A0A1J1HMQ4_9DIPT|nr:CLUMA_CG003103, isoform A [Clunio marinus]
MIVTKPLVLLVLAVSVVFATPINKNELSLESIQRNVREIDWNFFSRTTKKPTTTTTAPPKLPNNLEIGHCEDDDKIIYIDDTRLEANNSTLGGVIEIHIDSPYYITCVKVLDQMPAGTGAIPTYNSGGYGKDFIFINAQGQYGHGIHFKIIVRGNLKMSENEISRNK